MIKKLKMIPVEEQKKALNEEFKFPLFDEIIKRPVPPDNEELMDKVNEIIDYINGKEG